MSTCGQCGCTGIRTGLGMELSDAKAGDAWLCDIEVVVCSSCRHAWTEVVKECREWARESQANGRKRPYFFLEAGRWTGEVPEGCKT